MARRGAIEIPVGIDTGGVEKSIQNGLIDPIEDAEDALKQLDKAGDKLDIDKDMKKAQKATEQLDDELDDTRKSLDKLGYAAKEAGNDGKAGLSKIGDGAKEVQQEIGQNLGEAVSSMRGDLSDLGQVGQDTLGGLAASLAGTGPAGLVGAVGLAGAAVGWGLIAAEQEAAKERQERINEAAADWAGAYEDAADRIVSASYIVAEMQDIASDSERYQTAKDNAKDWGVSVSDAMRAMAGDGTALEIVQRSLNDKQREWNDILKETSTGSGASYDKSTMTAQQRELGDELSRGTRAIEEQNEAMGLGAEIAANSARALYDYASTAGVATGETDDLGNAILRLPDDKEIVVDAKTKKAYEDIDALEKQKLNDKSINVNITANRRAFDDSMSQLLSKNYNVTVNPRLGAEVANLMTHLITATNGAGTTTPLAVEDYELSLESRSIFHDTLDGGIGFSYVPPRPRAGTITLVFETRADAFAAVLLHGQASQFSWLSSEAPEASMTYAVDGSASLSSDGILWRVRVDCRVIA